MCVRACMRACVHVCVCTCVCVGGGGGGGGRGSEGTRLCIIPNVHGGILVGAATLLGCMLIL